MTRVTQWQAAVALGYFIFIGAFCLAVATYRAGRRQYRLGYIPFDPPRLIALGTLSLLVLAGLILLAKVID